MFRMALCREAWGRAATSLVLVLLVGCEQPQSDRAAGPGLQREAVATIEVSAEAAVPGEQIAISVAFTSEEQPTATQGRLRWDPGALRYMGQSVEPGVLTVVNSSRAHRGALDVVSVGVTELDRSFLGAFEVLAPEYANSLRYDTEIAVDRSGNGGHVTPTRGATETALPAVDGARILELDDWAALLSTEVDSAPIHRIPGQFDVFGDADGNATINVLDALYAANVAVGNSECVVGTDSPALDCIAVNVWPNNPPGLGTPDDACPPGLDSCGAGSRTVNVLDVLPIRLESVGVDQPVVGEAIPKLVQSTDTVVVPGPATITGTRTFSADTLYIVRGGIITVGIEVGAAGEVRFEPGTRMEFDTTAALFVTRNGRIVAGGTATRPVTLTSELPASGVRVTHSWGGVWISGNAVLNEGDFGLPPHHFIPGRNPGGGLQKQGQGGAVNFGGVNDADSSGSLKHVVIAYAGRSVTGQEVPNLMLAGCGVGTVVENVQVHAGSDDGIEVVGGRCDLKHVYATANDDDSFDFSFGYDGSVQFALAQLSPTGGNRALEVDNTEDASTYSALPRTAPTIYNFTFVDPGGGTSMNLRRGAAGTYRNGVVAGSSIFLDYDNDCSLIGAELTVETTVVYSNATLGDGTPCGPDVVSYLAGSTVDQLGAHELVDPFDVALPDFRPRGSGVSSAFSPSTPPAGFEMAVYLGAVAPEGSGGSIPWYSGWTIGWQSATQP